MDLRQPIDEGVAKELRAAFADHLLVLFRQQQLSVETQAGAVGIFGPVLDEYGEGSIHSVVSNIDDNSIGGATDQELVYHSDLTNTGSPAWGISLYAIEITADAPGTCFVSTQHAYRNLSASMREQIHGVSVTDISKQRFLTDSDNESDISVSRMSDTHPAVITHPRNSRPQIYCNRLWTNEVVGMDDAAARVFLDKLFDELYDESNTYEHEWTPGDFILWDNIAVQHARGPIPATARRHFRRVAMGTSTPELALAMRAGLRSLKSRSG